MEGRDFWQVLLMPRLNRAIDRCIAGQPAYVYNVLFWTRVIEGSVTIKSDLDPAQLAQAYDRASRCLTFEVDFDSSATTHMPLVTQSSHLHTQGLRLQFGPTGNFLGGGNQTLVYLSYQYNIGKPVERCSVSTSTTDGLLETVGGRLSVAGNRVRISSEILVAQQPTGMAVLNCPSPAPPTVMAEKHWQVAFDIMHRDLIDPGRGSRNFRNWRYTGGEHFGEAIYVRTETVDSVTFDMTTYLIMIHTAQP